MVCKNGGIYGVLGASWVLITYNVCPPGIASPCRTRNFVGGSVTSNPKAVHIAKQPSKKPKIANKIYLSG